MYFRLIGSLLLAGLCACAPQDQNQELNQLIAEGGEWFNHPSGCQDCHGSDALGESGPAIDFGPTPAEIAYELDATEEMVDMQRELQLSEADILAVSVYILDLAGTPHDQIDVASLRETFNEVGTAAEVVVAVSEREQRRREIETFAGVLEGWERRAATGPLRQTYDVDVIAEFDPGEPMFEPEPGTTYFYENTGTMGVRVGGAREMVTARTMQVVVGNAATKEIVAYSELAPELRSNVHGTALSPDGRYVYIVGSSSARSAQPAGGMGGGLNAPATMLKVDALTLQPIRQLDIRGRLHHAQIYQDRYILFDTFVQDPDGLAVFLMDPETDEIVGGVTSEDLGGRPYTAYTDHEHIYILMEIPGYGNGAVNRFNSGELTSLPPSWIAKLDPETWEVIDEFPHPGFRADWICFDDNSDYMYVPATGASNITKMNKRTGEIIWTNSTGPGPYGCAVNADGTEVWTADKGEGAGVLGRTTTVLDTETGGHLETLLSAYQVDHVLLDPTGTEFWLTANREGSIHVFDANTYERKNVIEMPNAGSPHGLVWVHYDEQGNAQVVADQGGFHSGVNPQTGNALSY